MAALSGGSVLVRHVHFNSLQGDVALIHAFERATGVKGPYVIGPRRDGDLARCWANAEKAKTLLDWTADMTLEEMCRDSWNFVQKA